MFKHVLIPTDGSEVADKAVETGVGLAQALGARVTFLIVVEPFHLFDLDAAQVEETRATYAARADTHATEVLERAERVAGAASVACASLRFTSDQPHQTIVEAATRQGCDLIAMASHGRRGLAALMLGSQTMKVLVSSKIPVLVLR